MCCEPRRSGIAGREGAEGQRPARAGRKTRRGIRRGTRGDGRGSDRTGDAGAGKGASGPTLRPISVPGSSRTHLGVETRLVVSRALRTGVRTRHDASSPLVKRGYHAGAAARANSARESESGLLLETFSDGSTFALSSAPIVVASGASSERARKSSRVSSRLAPRDVAEAPRDQASGDAPRPRGRGARVGRAPRAALRAPAIPHRGSPPVPPPPPAVSSVPSSEA